MNEKLSVSASDPLTLQWLCPWTPLGTQPSDHLPPQKKIGIPLKPIGCLYISLGVGLCFEYAWQLETFNRSEACLESCWHWKSNTRQNVGTWENNSTAAKFLSIDIILPSKNRHKRAQTRCNRRRNKQVTVALRFSRPIATDYRPNEPLNHSLANTGSCVFTVG